MESPASAFNFSAPNLDIPRLASGGEYPKQINMPTYQKCDHSVNQLAAELIEKYETNQPLGQLSVKIDLVFAFADRDDEGLALNDALTKNGLKALGITRIVPLKDRALGRGDAEIALDGDHWQKVGADEQAALLDHELHHISVKTDRNGNVQYDDLNRPQLKLRKHDIEVGWFSVIAQRHGLASIERKQARQIMDNKGQFYWPDVAPTVELISNGKSTGPMPIGAFAKAAATPV